MLAVENKKIILRALFFSVWLSNCGSYSNYEMTNERSEPRYLGSNESQSEENSIKKIPTGEIETISKGAKLNWQIWPCDATNSATTVATDDGQLIDLTGNGPFDFTFSPAHQKSVNLHITGNICKSTEFGRRIAFVVDVSESMRNRFNLGSDPIQASGTCRRLDALRAVAQSFSDDENVRFALVAFDSGIYAHSGGFLNKNDFLQFADVGVVCPVGTDTNYRVALEKAEELFAAEDNQFSKEVYFISDGIPSSASDYGVDVADRIKEYGIIATMMLGASDNILKNFIASLTPVGNRLHITINTAAEMTSQLLTINSSSIQGGYFIFSELDNLSFSTKIPLDVAEGAKFDIANIRPSYDQYPAGLKLSLEFWDQRGALFSKAGILKWKTQDHVILCSRSSIGGCE